MKDWWKAPILQGPENDYGDYDFFIEELPKDYARWEFDKYRWKCDTCGKDSFLRFVAEHYFYCWDGWDSMRYAECWRCRLKGRISDIKWKVKNDIKKEFEIIKDAIEWNKISHANSFKYWYQLSRKIHRR